MGVVRPGESRPPPELPEPRGPARPRGGTTMTDRATWTRAASLDALEDRGRLVFRKDGRQIALFQTPHGVRACNNRCPHEGYPLREGSLDERCILTCNWHNWKFDLESGRNLYGGEGLRTYPVEIRGRRGLDRPRGPAVRRAPCPNPRKPRRSARGQRLRTHGARACTPAPARRRSPGRAPRIHPLVLRAHGVRVDPRVCRRRGLAHPPRRE